MQNTTVLHLPSGARLTLQDPDGKLRECFCQLFGSTEAGAVVIADRALKKHKHAQKRVKNGTGI